MTVWIEAGLTRQFAFGAVFPRGPREEDDMPEENEDVIFLDIKPDSRTGLGFPVDEASQKRARLVKLEQVRHFSRARDSPYGFLIGSREHLLNGFHPCRKHLSSRESLKWRLPSMQQPRVLRKSIPLPSLALSLRTHPGDARP
jgi:hypothetical protein